MAYGLRAYWEQETNQGDTDRIEILEDGYSGSAHQMLADGRGFTFSHDEITSESSDGLLNPQQNRIQVGKLDFYPMIRNATDKAVLDDILGAEDTGFKIVWKQNGSIEWTGYPNTKLLTYPETGGPYAGRIRANDFEILKAIQYPLSDSRQTIINTIADLFNYTGLDLDFKTATSWITDQTNDSKDFLQQIYTDTYNLRKYGRSAEEADETISVWKAIEKIGDPALIFKQIGGVISVEQISEFANPATVHETVYNADGSVQTDTTTVDRTMPGYTSLSNGSPVIKNTSENDAFPALKRIRVKYEHRTKISGIRGESLAIVDQDAQFQTYGPMLFVSDGDQRIQFSANITGESPEQPATDPTQASDGFAKYRLQSGNYFYDHDTNSWTTTSTTNRVKMNGGFSTSNPDTDTAAYSLPLNVTTSAVPAAADGDLTMTFILPVYVDDQGNDQTMLNALINEFKFAIQGALVEQDTSTSIDYVLEQSGGYSEALQLDNTWHGDGPARYARGAYRYNDLDGSVTADSWQRRGTTSGYRSFHENLLKEIMDFQRGRTRKLNADLWGDYHPSKVLQYNGQNFYYTGGEYQAVSGRWNVNLMRLNEQTATDTFDDVKKYGDSDSTSSVGNPTGGDSSTTTDSVWDEILGKPDTEAAWATETGFDNRFLKKSNNLSGLASAVTAQINLKLKDSSADLDVNTLVADGQIIAYQGGAPANQGNGIYSGDEFRTDVLKVPASSEYSGGSLASNPTRVSLFDVSTGKIDTQFIGGGSGGSVDWGDIGGTLGNQTDLANALDGKANSFTNRSVLTGISSTDVGNWNSAYTGYVGGGSVNNGILFLLRPNNTNISVYDFDDRYYTETEVSDFFDGTTFITGYNKSNWDTAHAQRGSQIAGTNLSWNDSQLNATDTNWFLNGLSFNSSNGELTASVSGASNQVADLDGRYAQLSGATFTGDVVVGSGASNIPSFMKITAGASSGGLGIGAMHGTKVIYLYNDGGSNLKVDAYDYGTSSALDVSIGGNGGNVGIGTPSPSYALDVSGDIRITGISYGANHAEGPSDPRLKSNYQLLDPLHIAQFATVRSYNKEGRDTREIGLRTDEMKKAHPLLVGSMKHDKYGTVETLSPYSLASVALAGVGELDRKQQTQTELIAQLRSRVATLEQELETFKN